MLSTARIPVLRRFLSIVLVLCLLLFSVLCIGAEAASVAFLVPENNAVPLAQASDYRDVEIITPANRYINAKKYIGSSTPSAYSYASNFTSATLLKSSSHHYNCHGFAWYFSGKTTGITDASAFWMNSYAITQYVGHGCYSYVALASDTTCDQLVQSTTRSKLRVGDIVLYVNGDAMDSTATYSHSAVITSIGSNGIYVNSKWGEFGLYRHKVDDCPYATTGYLDSTGDEYSDYAQVVVYRPLHNNANNSISPTMVNSTTYSLPAFISIDDSSHKTVCNCGRGYDVENHNFTQITTYRYKCDDCGHIYDSSISVNSSIGDRR